MGDWLTFEKMITPTIIQIIFWVLSVLVVLSGLVDIFTFGGGFWGVIRGLLWIIIGPILVRIYCEVIIVFFRINDHMKEISENTRKA
jgi:hypothetical protein